MPDIKEIVTSSDMEQPNEIVPNNGEEEVDTNNTIISELPCEHTKFGCPKLLSLNLKLTHEAFCDFQPCKCPYIDISKAECSWKGLPGQLLSHMTNWHKIVTTFYGTDATLRATNVNVHDEFDWCVLQECYGHNFILVLRKRLTPEGNARYIAYAQLIGTRKQANRYYYELKLPGDCRSIKWQAKIRSLFAEDGSQEKSDCLTFNSSIAELFIANGTLVIHCSIKRKFCV